MVPAAQTGAIPSRLDGVLWHQPVLPASARAGRVDQTARKHVLLKTVVLGANEDQAFAGFGLRTAAPIPPARNWTARRGGAMRRRGLQG